MRRRWEVSSTKPCSARRVYVRTCTTPGSLARPTSTNSSRAESLRSGKVRADREMNWWRSWRWCRSNSTNWTSRVAWCQKEIGRTSTVQLISPHCGKASCLTSNQPHPIWRGGRRVFLRVRWTATVTNCWFWIDLITTTHSIITTPWDR